MNTISVLIPAHNEGERLATTIKALWNTNKIEEIVVIDDGSSDDTAIVASKYGARVVCSKKNVGKGKALTIGYSFVKGDIVILVDADLQESASLTVALVEPILKNEADLVIAVFPPDKRGSGFGIARYVAQVGIKLLTKKSLNAPLSGQRALKRKVLADLLPLTPGFGIEVGMTIDALRKSYRIIEMPLNLTHCSPGRNVNGFIHRGKQFYNICTTIGEKLWK
ncbi:MAG: glycosyltransferase family 2 protein [Clostridia bacterium]|nr:glycosyltransferase family 2 protein [Clostridia bacterium]MDD4047836.1 glycosyltransferase family 2 protein [Clostridia bacterium]